MIVAYVSLALLAIATVYSGVVSFRKTEGATASWIFPMAVGWPTRIGVGACCVALLMSLALWLGWTGQHSSLRASRFLIPEGYTGWVRVEFEVRGAPPLSTVGGEYVLRIPADGILRTSSSEQYGWARDHYYYHSAEGVRPIPDSGQAPLIWGKINGEASGAAGKRKYEEFFVGTAQQFKNQAKK
jgi:hypothetical protein